MGRMDYKFIKFFNLLFELKLFFGLNNWKIYQNNTYLPLFIE